MYKRRQIGLITSILLLHGCSQGAEEFAGRVIRILDGDTIEALHNRSPERIRLAEIDAPEKSQPFGTRAPSIRPLQCAHMIVIATDALLRKSFFRMGAASIASWSEMALPGTIADTPPTGH